MESKYEKEIQDIQSKYEKEIQDVQSKYKRKILPEFICPITLDLLVDPVVAADGYTYERRAITKWLETRMSSPLTNLKLASSIIIPNHVVKSLLIAHKEQLHEELKELEERRNKKFRELKDKCNAEQVLLGLEPFKDFNKPSKSDRITRFWNEISDKEKNKLLYLKGISSYDFLDIRFIQELSNVLKQSRYNLKDEKKGNYLSTKVFWDNNTSQHGDWLTRLKPSGRITCFEPFSELDVFSQAILYSALWNDISDEQNERSLCLKGLSSYSFLNRELKQELANTTQPLRYSHIK